MMQGPLIVQKDDVDKVPKVPHDAPPWLQAPAQRRQDWRVVAVWCFFGLIGALVAWLVIGDEVRDWIAFGWGGPIVKYTILGALALAGLHQLKQLALIEQPGGYKLLLWQAAQADGREVIAGSLQVQQTYAGTPFRNVAAYTLTQPQAPKVEPVQQIIDVPALHAPAASVPALTSEADWFPWLDTLPHLLISGRTDAGKTTLAEAIIAHRVNAGDLIHIIDPHYQPGKWCGVEAIGGGRNYDAVFASLDALRAELDARYEQFNAGKPTSEFQRLTVVVDEVPAIISRAVVNGKIIDKRLYERWLLFATGLGSEARKVRLSVIALSQSHLVRDIYISSAMRENFTRLALGETAADLLREEIDHTKRQALIGLLAGRRYPAAMEYRGALYALRNDEVPALARTMRAQPQPWPGSKAVVSDKAAKISAYRAKIRRMGDAEWRAEVQRLATAPGERRGGYRFTIEQIRALVGRDQNTVAELCKEARQKAGIKV